MAAPDQRTSIQENFDRSHATHARSATLQRIWRDAYGDEYPEETSPSNFIPRSTLRRLADALRVGPGDTLVDLGCGRGWRANGRSSPGCFDADRVLPSVTSFRDAAARSAARTVPGSPRARLPAWPSLCLARRANPAVRGACRYSSSPVHATHDTGATPGSGVCRRDWL